MQNNTTEMAATPTKSTETATQPQPAHSNAFSTRISYNPRFAVTPETMGIQCSTNNLTTREAPFVDVKPYNERHNIKPLGSLVPDIKHESNVSFHSSHSNTPSNSYASIRTENLRFNAANYSSFSPTPSASPKTPSQQWNFDASVQPESLEQQQNHIYTSSAVLSPKAAMPSSAQFMPSASSTLCSPTSSSDLSSPVVATNDIPHMQCASNGQSVITISDVCHEQSKANYRSGSDGFGGNSAKSNYDILNQIYSKRIKDIDANVCGDKDLKISTYQEWIEMLTKINESFIINMEELEREVAERLELVQRKVNSNCRHSQGNELMKCRKDIDTLLKYIKNARNYNSWDLQGFTFETITPSQVLEMGEFEQLTIEGNGGDAMKNCNEADVMQRNKLFANMKALAHEVAEKHDEVRELRRQLICLEDEIQKAQKKIQLKDDVIKELRSDLKCANNKLSTNSSVDTNSTMPPINFENQTSRSANTQITDCITPTFQEGNGSQFDSLSHVELEVDQQLKLLEKEMDEFFEMNTELNNHKMDIHRKRLKDIFQKLESEKAAAYRKLDFIRRQLIDLESDSTEWANNDGDSGFHSKSEHDQDAKILEAVRKRLRKLNDHNGDLKKRIQKLELENSELSNGLHSEKSFSQRNGETLKEVADLLSGMRGKQFSYTDIYNATPSKINPFCEAILDMNKGYQERESNLLKAIDMQTKEINDLSLSLFENEKDLNENSHNLKDIHNTATTQSSATSQTPVIFTTRNSISISVPSSPPPQLPSPTLTATTGQKLETAIVTVTSLQPELEKK